MKSKTKKSNFLNKKSFIFFIASFVFLQVLSTIQTLSLGASLASIEKKEDDLLKENHQLTSEIIKSTSLSQLEKRVEESGFTKPEYNLYINIDSFVAKAN